MRGLLLALLVAGAALAGCTQAPSAADVDAASDGAPDAEENVPAPMPPTRAPTPANRTDSGKGNGTATNGTAPQGPGGDPRPALPREWPALDAATVRPGVQTFYGGMQCTSNFVFTSPDNATVYLGSAAHCFGAAAKVGEAVEIGDGVATGVLAYSSWLTMGHNGKGYTDPGDPGDTEDAACAHEEDQVACVGNDFALIRIDEGSEALVHPAMLHFGGPTALAPSAQMQTGQKVLVYGNTWLRQGIEPTNWHEGYVFDRADAWTTNIYTVPPGLQGDSGSGTLTGDGRAFGVLVTGEITPRTGSSGIASLDLALAYAGEKAGVEVQLATWDLLDPGLLPPL